MLEWMDFVYENGIGLIYQSPFKVGAAIIFGAIILDLMIGDPRWLPHPVVGMGKCIQALEKALNRGSAGRLRKIRGMLLALCIVGGVFSLSYMLVGVAYHIQQWLGWLVEIVLLSTTIAIKGLKDAALQVYHPLSTGNLIEARKKLSWIVGRDTEHLAEQEITRGAVETVAENTVDGITAPLFFALLGGAPLALAYRAVNTLDSMVGYKNERYGDFGWASARFDDLLNWIPARLTALALWFSALVLAPRMMQRALWVTLRDAKKHPSPNSGWSEAMVAGLLGIQVGGINSYQGVVSERAKMGDPLIPLFHNHILSAIRFMHGGWIVFIIYLLVAWFFLDTLFQLEWKG